MITPRSKESIIVLGGTGFLGRRVVQMLLDQGFAVSIATRYPKKITQSNGDPNRDVRVVQISIRDSGKLERAFVGAATVVNCIGHYFATRTDTFRDVHVNGACAVAKAAMSVGVSRLVHISGIGANRISASTYVRARAQGEDEVRRAFPAATILRPSVMFSRSGAFFGDLDSIVRRMPILPLFGDGSVRLQPVYVGDVAKAVARASDFADCRGRVYELGGPDVFSYKDIIQRLAQRGGKKRLLLPVPYKFWWSLAAVLAILPKPPITSAQVALMQQDNVVGANVANFTNLGIDPKSAIALGLV
ncbi:complex I NDUFA9 subunit family protein [Ruegeria sp. Ofav3-42]|uniref:complex I NDUFA9 subunit family protein n=1 Tax=Ruegeria sp. Ofav3-42 TaxID=2917759 RepID=UPI001EF6F4F6|nr:complex I NDUFA9 subunit family protein [Ruegeria sp. Ofav3-42]